MSIRQPLHAAAVFARAALGDGPRYGDGKMAIGRTGRLAWFGVGLLMLAGCLTALEVRQPFFFTQDDNFVVNLPGVLWGCRSLFKGVLCTFNSCQFLGSPAASMPQSLLVYPPTYFAFLVARLLGNEYLTVEVFCITHLALGYAAAYWAARQVGMRPAMGMAGSLSYVLSGYVLIAGRSWMHVMPAIVFMPLIVVSVARMTRGPVGGRWFAFTALVFGGFIGAGYPQTWVYGMLFFVIALIVSAACGAVPWRRALVAIPALLAGFGLAMVVLYPQTMEAVRFLGTREVEQGAGIGKGLLAMLLPFPLARAPHPNNWGSAHYELMGQFYYSGTVFCAVGLLALVAMCVAGMNRRTVGRNVWLVMALIAFVLALGRQGGLWTLIAKLPVMEKFTGPFKMLLYLNLFIMLGAGLIMERLAMRSYVWRIAIPAVVCGLMVYHCLLPLPSFYSFKERPYPQLPAEMTRVLRGVESPTPARIIAFAPYMSPADGFVKSLMNDFATVYGYLNVFGYEALVRDTIETTEATKRIMDDPTSALAAYGVRWMVIHRLAFVPEFSANPDQAETEGFTDGAEVMELLLQHARRVVRLDDVMIFELNDPSPMSFAESKPDRPLPIRFDGSGARVDVSSIEGGPVIVNVIMRHWMTASADGRPVDIASDDWGRVVAEPPVGTKVLRIRYSPPWMAGLAIGFVVIAVALGLARVLNPLQKADRRAEE